MTDGTDVTDVNTVVSQGYKSLAERTLEQYERLVASLPEHDWPEAQAELAAFEAFKALLVKIKEEGGIRSLTNPEVISLYNFIQLLESSIPAKYKPQDADFAMSVAISAAMAYFDIPTLEDLVSRASISQIRVASGKSDLTGIFVICTPEGQQKRMLYATFDQQAPALSIIINVHDLYYALQPEIRQTLLIHEGLTRISGYNLLISTILSDDNLREQCVRTVIATHQLDFLKLPEVLDLAARLGADADGIRAYVHEHLPLMNFLTCYITGDAYVTQTGILQTTPDFRYPSFPQPVLQALVLMSLADALIAPFQPQKSREVCEAGIGIAEFVKNHPQDKDALMRSKEFHQALTDAYFSNIKHA